MKYTAKMYYNLGNALCDKHDYSFAIKMYQKDVSIL